jgi:rhamnogalacturonyl hydrolase YesR
MDNHRLLTVVVCQALSFLPATGCGSTRPPLAAAPPLRARQGDLEPYAVRGLMSQVADRALARFGRTEALDWRRAALYAGIVALADIAEDPAYVDAVRAVGDAAAWRPSRAEAAVAAIPYLGLYQRERDPRTIEPTVALFDELTDTESDDPGLEAFAEPGTAPTGAVLTAPAALALATTITGDGKYLALAEKLWARDVERLYDPAVHLFASDAAAARPAASYVARTTGWALAGMARTLEHLPDDSPARARLQGLLREVASALCRQQRADGSWPARLSPPAVAAAAPAPAAPAPATQDHWIAGEVGDEDLAATALAAYGLAWGVNHGVLERAAYEAPARRAWAALARASRNAGAPPGALDIETTAGLLLAGTELFRLVLFEGSRAAELVAGNPLAEGRFEDTAEIPWGPVARELGVVPGDPVIAVDARSGRFLPSQLLDLDGDGQAEQLLVSLSLHGSESRRIVVRRLARPFRAPRAVARAYGRFVPERRDDFAWENDRVAFRVYGPALEREQVSSGIDVWAKRVRTPVIDRWYPHEGYRRDRGEGLDFYSVGPSRGCGGLGLWEGQQLYTSRNFHRWRLIAAGPVRVAFELGYDPWGAGAMRVTETKRISLDLGQNLSRIEARFTVEGPARPLPVAVGIVRRGEGRLSRDLPTTWLSYVEPPQGSSGQIGCGVIAPDNVNASADAVAVRSDSRFVESDEHYLLVRQHPSQRPFVYYAGAYWSKAPDFREPDDWSVYLAAFSRRSGAPITVQPVSSR